jgi:Cdc6-like AAA superfamily ATPase
MTLLDLVRRRPPAPPQIRPVEELSRRQLTPNRRREYRQQLFQHELDDLLATDLADDLATNTAVPASFLRQSCLREEKALCHPAQETLDEVEDALDKRARVRDQKSAGSSVVHWWAFTPGLRRLVLSLGAAIWVLAFAYSTPGDHGADTAQPALLWIAGLLTAGSAAISVAEWRGMRHPVLFVAQTVALAAAPLLLVTSGMRITTVRDPQSGLASISLLTVAVLCLLALLGAFQAWAYVDRYWASSRVAGLRISVLTGLILVAFVTLPTVGMSIVLGAGTANRRLDIVEPNLVLWPLATIVVAINFLLGSGGYLLTPYEVVDHRWRDAQDEARDLLRNKILLPHLRQMINRAKPSYRTTLNVTRPAGLSQAFDPIYEVPTSATRRLEKTLAMLPGGSVGIAGPRGVGKSTILSSFCERDIKDSHTLRVLVSAPVEYEPRDFLLHLYAQICRAALRLRDGHRPPPDPIHWLAARQPDWAGYALAGLTGFAGLLILGLSGSEYALSISQIIALVLILIAAGLGIHVAFRRGPKPKPEHEQDDTLEDAALVRLHEIEYQQSIAGEYAGGFKAPAGLESSLKRSTGFVRQQMTLPEIVDSLRQFLRFAASRISTEEGPRLIVGIDELDKIEDEARAQQFLNDIKSVFGVAGTHFLVSVSEDAMSSFERRGLPFRDVFDSAFDEIISIEYLTFAESSELIGRRTTEISVPFKGLSFCLSGGLPRDLIRAARTMVEISENGDRSLRTVAARLVARDLSGKATAVAAAIRKVDAEPATSRLLIWCRRIPDWTGDYGDFAAAMAELDKIGFEGRDEADYATLRRMAREIASYAYYCHTLVGFFGSTAAQKATHAYDELAGIRRSMAANPLVGWELISEFRQARSLPAVDPPNGLVNPPVAV